jgi:hypothetical protein
MLEGSRSWRCVMGEDNDHPSAGSLKEQSREEKSGFADQRDEYAGASGAKDSEARGEAIPPRGGSDAPREPLAARVPR